MVRNREKKIPPEPPQYIMVLGTVVSSELIRTWTVQLSWLWNLWSPQHVGHWKSEHTFYISFSFSVSPGFVEVRGITYQQLSRHSSWSNIHSLFLKEVRDCRPADSCRLRQNNRAVCVYPTVDEPRGGVGTGSSQCAARLHGPAWNGMWAQNRRLTAPVSKRGEHDAAGTPTSTQPDWVSEADTTAFLGTSEPIHLREHQSESASSAPM